MKTEYPEWEQDSAGEWAARAQCGHTGNPDEMSADGARCVNCDADLREASPERDEDSTQTAQ